MTNYKEQLESIKRELETICDGNAKDDFGETYTFYDYIADKVLSLNYIVDADKRYVASELCLSFEMQNGGTNIFIETNTQEIRLFSGNGCETVPLPTKVCDELDEIYFDFYNEENED